MFIFIINNLFPNIRDITEFKFEKKRDQGMTLLITGRYNAGSWGGKGKMFIIAAHEYLVKK